MDSSLLTSLQEEFSEQVSGVRTVNSTQGKFVPKYSILPDVIADGIEFDSLYKHQADAIELLKDEENVCLTTGTDSGKTLVYALYSAIKARNSGETALCIYPTKALSRDQKESLEEIYSSLNLDLVIGVYDGDTSQENKKELRSDADIILTNFQGLNYYLPHHSSWENFFSDLGLVVIDEAHMYTGVMGTHTSWITRRLLRICERVYNSDPQVIITTATLGNPKEHSETLTGKNMTVIDTDHSPQEEQNIILWNPEKSGPNRISPHRAVSKLAPWVVNKAQKQILIFTPSRRTSELCMKWVQEESRNHSTNISVESYHAGHSKKSRRKTEDKIKSGDLDIVISTTALEVGIDIGSLDIVMTDTYPGSRMSFWQQIGRAGRENSESTTFFVADRRSVDQYIIDNPDYLLGDTVEDAIVDLSNEHISSKHIATATSEYPVVKSESEYFTDDLESIITKLKQNEVVSGGLHSGATFSGSYRPEAEISIYSTSGSGFTVKIVEEEETKQTLPEVSRTRAYRELFPGATYLHKGTKYLVEEFIETETRKEIQLVESDSLDYYTQSDNQKRVTDVNVLTSKMLDYGVTVYKGNITVQEKYPSYSKIYDNSEREDITGIPTGLDESIDLQTEACWITFDAEISEQVAELTSGNLLGSLHGAEHTMIELSPVILNVDSKDIGGLSMRHHKDTGRPTIFIYDGIDGGIGYSFRIYNRLQGVSSVSSGRLMNCSCDDGCLECVMSSNCGSQNEPLHKKGSAIITESLSTLLS